MKDAKLLSFAEDKEEEEEEISSFKGIEALTAIEQNFIVECVLSLCAVKFRSVHDLKAKNKKVRFSIPL